LVGEGLAFVFVVVLVVVVGFEFEFVVVVVVVVVVVFAFVAGVDIGVETGAVLVIAELLAGLLVLALFVAASPQAIPNAPITRTAESAINFFIISRLLSFSKCFICFQKSTDHTRSLTRTLSYSRQTSI